MMREPTDIRRQQAQRAVQALRARVDRLDDDAIDLILRDARSHYAWTDRPVGEDLLRTLFEITIAGPTSMNTWLRTGAAASQIVSDGGAT